ncbi:hypothetical protein CMV_022671 [Castanea mollissima]|uniref:ABC transmembrane type-1 domain-containing protein n=1 Tax=Castanea mollissima TaxID=60419 RepID=A0A8J4QJ48_9ROSI|nr:hypothetical protein CMV_022671 [Castanea mollissima]
MGDWSCKCHTKKHKLEVKQGEKVNVYGKIAYDADVYILDDPFSAVDAHTATTLFNLMIEWKVLRASTYDELLASRQEFQNLVNADHDTVGSKRQAKYASSRKSKTSKSEIQGNYNEQNSHVNRVELITVYIVIGCILALFVLISSIYVVILGFEVSQSIFYTLLTSLFRKPLSFYDSTPRGRILNRVSSYLIVIDLDFAFKLSTALGYFFASVKELMRTDGTTRSLIASHLAESIARAMTIRVFGEEERFLIKNLDLIDRNASPYFHSFSADEWLIQRLEIPCAIVYSVLALAMTLLQLGASASSS